MSKKKNAYFSLLFCFIMSASWAQQNDKESVFTSENNSKTRLAECFSEENTTPTVIVSTLTTSSTIEISDDILISDINMAVNISHSWMSDIVLELVSPSGTSVILIANKCSGGADMDAIFDDAGDAVSCSGTPVISGTLTPEELLSAFNGENSIGTWTLNITDVELQIEGVLNSWSIEYCSGTVLSTETFNDLNNMMYPNPATDIVSFKLDNSSEFEVSFFDALGRKVVSKRLDKGNNGIDVSNLASGTYIVQMQNENNEKIIKNLIIE